MKHTIDNKLYYREFRALEPELWLVNRVRFLATPGIGERRRQLFAEFESSQTQWYHNDLMNSA